MTGNLSAWALYALAQKPGLQARLREELRDLPETPSQDDLNALPLLDAVVREALRLHPPVGYVTRTAVSDDVIPLSIPIKDASGAMVSEVQ